MKKKLLNLFMLVLFASAILLTSCDASGGMPGASADFSVSSLKEKAFVYNKVESDDNEPETSVEENKGDDNQNESEDSGNGEENNDGNSGDGYNDGNSGDGYNDGTLDGDSNDGSSEDNSEDNSNSSNEFTDEQDFTWVYFKDVSSDSDSGKASFGTITYKVTTNLVSGESKREKKENSTKVKYHGDFYIKSNIIGKEVPDFYKINYEKKTENNKSEWKKLEKENEYYSPSEGLFKDSNDSKLNKKYEYKYEENRLIIKLTERKSNDKGISYDEWTTWYWDEIEPTELMKTDYPGSTSSDDSKNDESSSGFENEGEGNEGGEGNDGYNDGNDGYNDGYENYPFGDGYSDGYGESIYY